MERGVYAQGWFPRSHNYHPSLPPRRLHMVADFVAYRATMTTWPCLGGGAISLAYLEDEAHAPVPARYRQYGFLKDSEFLAECRSHGVKAFSVIFSTQGWEFPAELSDDETEILAMNELRGVGRRTWLGLREFTQNTHPKIWAPFERYFPNGLTNSRGEPVHDLFEECASRDIHGRPHHADWLEVPTLAQQCHFMDINNPVWREYLKAIVRIHVDAGVDGIQFDEPDSPLAALAYGGSFSYDNVSGFRDYLQGVDPARVPDSVQDLASFDYGSWLLGRGRERVDLRADGDEGTVARLYARFMQGRQAANFAELAGYVREYAKSRNRTVLVSSNLYDGATWHDPLVPELDVLVPEQRHTLYEQPAWMRYIAAFAGDKSVCISTNPYGGVLPELLTKMNRGRDLDRYRVMLCEAAALGVNLSVPYGAWMGSVIEDAMWAPHEETVQIQDFLADHEDLFSRATLNSTLIAFSIDSSFLENVWQVQGAPKESRDVFPDVGEAGSSATPYQRVAHAAALSGRPFDVAIFHDGLLRADDASVERLGPYSRVVLPGCSSLTAQQVEAVGQYLDGGGHVSVYGELGGPNGPEDVARLLAHPRTTVAQTVDPDEVMPGPQVVLTSLPRGAVNIQRTAGGGAALHIINYDYDTERECTHEARDVDVLIDLPFVASTARLHSPGSAATDLSVTNEGSLTRFCVPRLGVYAVVELRR